MQGSFSKKFFRNRKINRVSNKWEVTTVTYFSLLSQISIESFMHFNLNILQMLVEENIFA